MRVPLSWLRRVRRPARRHAPARDLADALVRVGLEVETVERARRRPDRRRSSSVACWRSPTSRRATARPSAGARSTSASDEPRGIVCGAHNFAVGDAVVVALPGAVLPGRLRDRRAQDLRPRLRRDDLLGPRARPRRRAHRHPRAADDGPRRCPARGRRPAGARAAGRGARHRRHPRPRLLPVGPRRRPRARGRAGPAVHATRPTATCRPRRRRLAGPRSRTRRAATASSRAPSPASTRRPRRRSGCAAGSRWPGCARSSLAVDVTNYVMLELGQPIHGYDRAPAERADRRAPGRRPDGEGRALKLETLDGVVHALDPEDLSSPTTPARSAWPA